LEFTSRINTEQRQIRTETFAQINDEIVFKRVVFSKRKLPFASDQIRFRDKALFVAKSLIALHFRNETSLIAKFAMQTMILVEI
jgi:hypothetical protein